MSMPHEAVPQVAVANESETSNRRNHRRHAGKAVVHVIRERDPARTRSPAKLLDLSIAGIGLLTAVQIEVNDQVRVRLQNDIQRISKEVRGTVRWMAPTAEGEFRLGIELSPRLSANDLMALTRVGKNFGTGTGKVWM
jgi:hypothetical protein